MATQNTINKKSGSLTIDPGVSGDSYLQLDINGTNEFIIGVDDDASDAFKISLEGTLGAVNKDTFIMSAAGERTMPLQPCFMVKEASAINNVTGDGTAYTVVWDTEVYDIGSNMTATTFTAPVDGKYLFHGKIYWKNFIGATALGMEIYADSIRYGGCTLDPTKVYFVGDGSYYEDMVFELLDLDASDTVVLRPYMSGMAKTVDIVGDTGAQISSFFMGALVC